MSTKQNSRKYLFVTVLMIFFSMDSHAKTCEGDNPRTWNNCIGSLKLSNDPEYGSDALYIGEFKDGKFNGLGSIRGSFTEQAVFTRYHYQGQFSNGLYQGLGLIVSQKGTETKVSYTESVAGLVHGRALMARKIETGLEVYAQGIWKENKFAAHQVISSDFLNEINKLVREVESITSTYQVRSELDAGRGEYGHKTSSQVKTASNIKAKDTQLASEVMRRAVGLTQTQIDSFSKKNVGLLVELKGKLFNAVPYNLQRNEHSADYPSGNALLVIDIDPRGKAFVNIPKNELGKYSDLNRGTKLSMVCRLTSVSDYHISCDLD